MLFLLNDVVFDLNEASPPLAHDQHEFDTLDFFSLITLGCELFAQEPRLQQRDPVRARRLAWLIAHHGEGINAAQFYTLQGGCDPLIVEPRFCVLPLPVLQALKARNASRRQKTASVSLADQIVWSQRAA